MRRLKMCLLIMLLILSGCQIQPLEPESVRPSPDAIITQPPAEPTATQRVVTPSPDPSPTVPLPPFTLAEEPAAVSFALPLAIQHVTDTTAALYFELDEPADGLLLYWPVEAPHQQAWSEFTSAISTHQITLDDLLPGQSYQAIAALRQPGDPHLNPIAFPGHGIQPIRFRTYQPGEPLRVGIIGDSGFGQQTTFNLVEQMAASDLDFIIHTGDLVYLAYENADPYEAFYLKWFEPFSPLINQMPIYPVIGNHELDPGAQWEGRPFYEHVFPPFPVPGFPPPSEDIPQQWYAFDYGPFQFIMLNTQTFYGMAGHDLQTRWLEERLGDERFEHTIVTFHVPPFSGGAHPTDGIPVRAWLTLFEGSNVRLVLSGHDHNYQRLQHNAITYIISGGGSDTLYGQTQSLPESIFFARQAHIVILELAPDQMMLQAVALGGEIIDATAIPLP